MITVRDKRCIRRCFTPLVTRRFTREVANKQGGEQERRGKRARRRRTLATPIKAETIQVQARWPTSGFETEALFAMHLRYTRERKRRGCGKGKGKVERMT